MRSLVFSDAHANDDALAAVLDHIRDVDELWCLGDTVGYGASPRECLELISKIKIPVRRVAGNHDLAAVDQLSLKNFMPEGREAIEWTRRELTARNRLFLNNKSLIVLAAQDATIMHGSPRDPIWAYIKSISGATAAFEGLTTRIGFFGHTHRPMIYYQTRSGAVDRLVPCAGRRIDLNALGDSQLINPGSVGQPRDGDQRASFLILDHEARWVEFHKVQYDIGASQGKILKAGLPPVLAERLQRGL